MGNGATMKVAAPADTPKTVTKSLFLLKEKQGAVSSPSAFLLPLHAGHKENWSAKFQQWKYGPSSI
jgi:hypothetical protein